MPQEPRDKHDHNNWEGGAEGVAAASVLAAPSGPMVSSAVGKDVRFEQLDNIDCAAHAHFAAWCALSARPALLLSLGLDRRQYPSYRRRRFSQPDREHDQARPEHYQRQP